MLKSITSIHNVTIKNIIKLQEKSRERKKQQRFTVEGIREVSLVSENGYTINSVYFLSDIVSETVIKQFLDKGIECITVSKEVYAKIAYRNSTEGIVAVVTTKNHAINTLKISNKTPLILVAEAPEKPGNIGAILRTADAANIDAVLIANPKSDLYNPNIIRSSVGCVFSTSVAVGTTEDIIAFLKENNIAIYSATLQNSNIYTKEDYTKPSAIVVGTEDEGLSEAWRNEAQQNINIPMQGQIDSMNVSVAAGILLFEAKRQRNFK